MRCIKYIIRLMSQSLYLAYLLIYTVTGHHFFDVFAPSYFLVTNMHVATEKFFLLRGRQDIRIY